MHSRTHDNTAKRAWPLAFMLMAAITLVAPAFSEPADSWPQWGGPNRDFKVSSQGLADQWPEGGPAELWSRDLGEGYSSVLAEGDRLYTMYRADDKEIVIALDAKTGKTVWEHRYESAASEIHVHQFGDGPRATPLLAGDHLYTIGVSGVMHSLKKSDGSVAWSHDLWKEFSGSVLNHGYSSSPIEYGDTVIALVGGEGNAIMAFNKGDGGVAWKGHDFVNSYSAARVFKIDGEDQLVAYMADEMVGVDPTSGALKWRYEIGNQYKQNISMPVLVDGQYLFLSSLQSGARGLKLSNKDGKTELEEIWSTRKIQLYHVTTVLQGDLVYGTTGGGAPHFMAAVNVKTGEIAWRKRGFTKSNCVGADGKIVVLDEDGKLSLITATPEDLTVHAEAQVLEKPAWTPPTLVGKTLYVRDQKRVRALNLG